MSTAAAFLECDPPDECPDKDTYNFGNGGSSQNQKVNTKILLIK